MSFFLGLAKGFTWAQDKKQEKEMFEAQMAWEREKILLSSKLSRQNAGYTSRLGREEEKAKLVKRALSLGFSEESIRLFESQGTLETLTDRAEKSGSSKYVEDLIAYATGYNLSEEEATSMVGDAAASGEEDLAASVNERLISPLSIRPPTALGRTDVDGIRRTAMQITAQANPSVTINPDTQEFDFTNTEEDQRLTILEQVSELTRVGEDFVASNGLSGNDLNFSGYDRAMTEAYLRMLRPPEPTTPLPGPEESSSIGSPSDMGLPPVPTAGNLAGIGVGDLRLRTGGGW